MRHTSNSSSRKRYAQIGVGQLEFTVVLSVGPLDAGPVQAHWADNCLPHLATGVLDQ